MDLGNYEGVRTMPTHSVVERKQIGNKAASSKLLARLQNRHQTNHKGGHKHSENHICDPVMTLLKFMAIQAFKIVNLWCSKLSNNLYIKIYLCFNFSFLLQFYFSPIRIFSYF